MRCGKKGIRFVLPISHSLPKSTKASPQGQERLQVSTLHQSTEYTPLLQFNSHSHLLDPFVLITISRTRLCFFWLSNLSYIKKKGSLALLLISFFMNLRLMYNCSFSIRNMGFFFPSAFLNKYISPIFPLFPLKTDKSNQTESIQFSYIGFCNYFSLVPKFLTK